jgi:hypothetical protein
MQKHRKLLVEGSHEKHIILALQDRWIKESKLTEKILEFKEINEGTGIDDFIKSLSTHLRQSDIEQLGIVIDADQDIVSRWRTLQNTLGEAGYQNIPASPEADGTIILAPENSLLPRLGVWLMPDNESNGILEDFVNSLIPGEDDLIELAQKAVGSIPEEKIRFSGNSKSKAIIYTWLAWQKKPGAPPGLCIKAQWLNADGPKVGLLMSWLKRLYT